VRFLPVVVVALVGCGSRTGLPFDEAAIGPPGADAGADAHTVVQCTPGSVTLSRADPSVMLVLDRSGSMGDALRRGTPGQNRWDILTEALAAALPPVDQTMSIGALFYPVGSSRQLTCTSPSTANVSPAKGQVSKLLSLMRAEQPAGGTPTADAIEVSARLIQGVRAATSARALILATDGEPNCNANLNPASCTCVESSQGCRFQVNQCLDDTRTVERIAAAAKQGLPTYVIGIEDQGDAQFASVLDEMAKAGGRPRTGGAHLYYSGNSEAELEDALVVIRNQVGSCTYLTSSVPDSRGSITVTVDGAPIPFDPSKTEGWAWTSEDNGELVLLGDTCAKLAAEPSAKLVAQVACGGK
jgi:von Willebrand factor type A domain